MEMDFDALLNEMPAECRDAIRADVAQTLLDRAARDVAAEPIRQKLAELHKKLAEVFAVMTPGERAQAFADMEDTVMAQMKDLENEI